MPAAAFARTISAYNNYGNTQSVSRNTYDRYQVVRVGGNSFTRTVDGVRHVFNVNKMDGMSRKITFEERIKGKMIVINTTFDKNNLGTLLVGKSQYPFRVDVKHKSISVSYGYAASSI
jgi:hypothetical protein